MFFPNSNQEMNLIFGSNTISIRLKMYPTEDHVLIIRLQFHSPPDLKLLFPFNSTPSFFHDVTSSSPSRDSQSLHAITLPRCRLLFSIVLLLSKFLLQSLFQLLHTFYVRVFDDDLISERSCISI